MLIKRINISVKVIHCHKWAFVTYVILLSVVVDNGKAFIWQWHIAMGGYVVLLTVVNRNTFLSHCHGWTLERYVSLLTVVIYNGTTFMSQWYIAMGGYVILLTIIIDTGNRSLWQ